MERIERLAASDRWCPAILDLGIALDNSRNNQTYNTPALATDPVLAVLQVDWINANGGHRAWAADRCEASSGVLYRWADATEYATAAYVTDPGAAEFRWSVTIDHR